LVVETVLSAAAGRVPVIVGVSGTTADVRMAATKHAVRVGAPAVLVALGGSAGEVAEELYRVADAGAKAVILQDWDPAGLGLPVETILELAEDVPALAGVKIEVAAAGAKYSAVLEAAGARLLVCGGWAVGQLIEALDRGVHAFMPTGLHAQYCEIVRRYRSGDRDGAQQVFRDLLPVLAFANQHLDISIHFFKRLLWRQGIYPTPVVRAPRLPFDDIHRRTADELIDHTLDRENALRARRRG
jgi:4-hydroxy-tetrahydrodipicolinate synthase